MTFINAIQTHRRYAKKRIKAMDHRLGYETVCQVWDMQFRGTPQDEIANALNLPSVEIRRLSNCYLYPHPTGCK